MRRIAKILTVAVTLGTMASAGCHLPGQKVGWGCEFRVYKPAYVSTEGQVLVQSDSGPITPQAVGNVAGPVSAGQWLHGTGKVPMMMPGAGVYRQDVGGCLPVPAPVQRTLTCEEWCQMMQAMKGQRMPPAQE